MVCLSADQFAENHLESNGVDVKRSKLVGRNGILTWKWILEYPDQLWNRVEIWECRQVRHRWKFLQYLHSTCTSARKTRIRDASSQQQRRRRCGGQNEDGDLQPILHESCENNEVVHYTNTHETSIQELLNEDGKSIDTGQIIITQKLQVCKNDINATMVSWRQLVNSVDKYITIVSTILVTAVTYLRLEYRSVHDGDRRGFTVEPTAKYVDECMVIVQLQHAKEVMTPLTEQKSLNLHDETTACDQNQHSLFRAVVGKLQYITGVRPDLMFATKCLSHKLASPTLADLTRAKKVLRYLKGTRELNLYLTIPALKPSDLNKTLKHITGYSDADWAGDR